MKLAAAVLAISGVLACGMLVRPGSSQRHPTAARDAGPPDEDAVITELLLELQQCQESKPAPAAARPPIMRIRAMRPAQEGPPPPMPVSTEKVGDLVCFDPAAQLDIARRLAACGGKR